MNSSSIGPSRKTGPCDGPDVIDGPDDFAEAFDVPRETIGALEVYAERLAHWQRTTNLVSPSTLPQVWSRHFADSAQLSKLAPKARLWLDLGSGGGFPGMVIAILRAQEANFRMHLVDSNHKKCAFLTDVARAAKAPVDIHSKRIEEFAKSAQSLKADVVSARALAPLSKLLSLAEPFLGEGTRGLFLKGREADAEIKAADAHWRFEAALHRSLTAPEGHVIEVTELHRRPT